MPKFSDSERDIIKQKLNTEGERLFTLHGIKKVTVDDLVNAAGIAKGSFYSFYKNKEHLFMEIAGNLQKEMWTDMDAFLEENSTLPPRELTKLVILWAFKQIEKYPLLLQANGEIAEYLYRKLPKEIIEAHTQEDSQELDKLQKYGVAFCCELEHAARMTQLLAINYITMHYDNYGDKDTVIEIMVNGIVNEIVRDVND